MIKRANKHEAINFPFLQFMQQWGKLIERNLELKPSRKEKDFMEEVFGNKQHV